MANSLLSPSIITKEALRILHNETTLINNVNRSYNDRFGKTGAKIGETLNIRKPNQFKIRRGRVVQVNDVQEETIPLTVQQPVGVDMEFDSRELTLTLDDFSQRYIRPAVSRLTSALESDMMKYILPRVPNAVVNSGAMSLTQALNAKAKLNEHLAPSSDRYALVNSQQSVDVVTGTSTLFNNQTEIGKQYREGRMGRAAGFDWYETTTAPRFFSGAGTGYLVNGANQQAADQGKPGETQTLVVDTGTGAIAEGTIFTIPGVYEVNPETKDQNGRLRQFTVISSNATPATSIVISPAIVTTGAKQNVNAGPADNAVITFATSASNNYDQGLFFHRDAFTLVTVDLEMPNGVDWKARETMDGVSMRLVRDWDIVNDAWVTRLDILPAYAVLYPDWAVKGLSTAVPTT